MTFGYMNGKLITVNTGKKIGAVPRAILVIAYV
jgi:hypothetical protein